MTNGEKYRNEWPLVSNDVDDRVVARQIQGVIGDMTVGNKCDCCVNFKDGGCVCGGESEENCDNGIFAWLQQPVAEA